MPQTSEKTRIQQYLQAKIVWENLLNDSDEDNTDSSKSSTDSSGNSTESDDKSTDSEDFALINEDTPEELLAYVSAVRYLDPRVPVPKSSDWCMNVLPNYDDARFRQVLRVSRYSFNIILQKIKSYSAFATNSSIQLPVEQQLQIALFRFGRFGNAASVGDVAKTFGISEGTVIKSTRRIVGAILKLEDTYLRWYTEEEKINMKRRIYRRSGFSECLGFLDGTTIVLAEKPVNDGELYYNRNSKYGLNCQIIADLDARIRFFYLGYPASVHDSRCIGESDLCGHPEEFFVNDEYVLADSAYHLCNNFLTPYKKPAALQGNNAAFNEILSSMRVRVEHCIGILKNRFQSLKGMRQRLSGKRSAKSIVDWVKACAILHNIILEIDEWDEEEAGEGPHDNELLDNELLDIELLDDDAIADDTVAIPHRERIKKQVLRFNNFT